MCICQTLRFIHYRTHSLAMAAFLRGSCLTSSTRSTTLAVKTRLPTQRRQFVTTIKLWQETVETPSRGPEVPLTSFTNEPKGSHARSVAFLKVNKRAARKEIEEFIRSKGFDV